MGKDLPGLGSTTPSPWVVKHAELIPAGGRVLDLACGKGRHTRYLLDQGYQVTAVDIDLTSIADLEGKRGLTTLQADLEGDEWPFQERQFDGVVVTCYLHRPILPAIIAAVAPGGVLIYETFAMGNEKYGRPESPDFLLKPGELLDAVAGKLTVMGYGHGFSEKPKPGVRQRIAAIRDIS